MSHALVPSPSGTRASPPRSKSTCSRTGKRTMVPWLHGLRFSGEARSRSRKHDAPCWTAHESLGLKNELDQGSLLLCDFVERKAGSNLVQHRSLYSTRHPPFLAFQTFWQMSLVHPRRYQCRFPIVLSRIVDPQKVDTVLHSSRLPKGLPARKADVSVEGGGLQDEVYIMRWLGVGSRKGGDSLIGADNQSNPKSTNSKRHGLS